MIHSYSNRRSFQWIKMNQRVSLGDHSQLWASHSMSPCLAPFTPIIKTSSCFLWLRVHPWVHQQTRMGSCEVFQLLSNQAIHLFTPVQTVQLRRINGCFFLLCKSWSFCFPVCVLFTVDWDDYLTDLHVANSCADVTEEKESSVSDPAHRYFVSAQSQS